MYLKSIVQGMLCLILCSGCEEIPEGNTDIAVQNQEQLEDSPNRTGETRISSAQTDQSCLQTCGLEARSGSYAECLEAGGVQKECGASARIWYRECIESRCTESDIQIDDCKTECRVGFRPEYEKCVSETGDEEQCRVSGRTTVRDCISECE